MGLRCTGLHGVGGGGAVGSCGTWAHCGVWPKRPGNWKPRPVPGSCGGGGRIARANCKLARLALNAFAASLLPNPYPLRPVPSCAPKNQQLCQQQGDCAWPAARSCQDWAGAGRAAGAPRWEQAGPDCQGRRINKAAHRLPRGRGEATAGRRENRCLRSAADTKGSCLLLLGPREQPPSPSLAQPREVARSARGCWD